MQIPLRLRIQPASKKLVGQMSVLCDAIERELDAGGTAEALLQRWHSHARRHYEAHEFRTYWEGVSKETFVRGALNPVPSFDSEVVYSEAIAVLETVGTATIPEPEIYYYLGWLEAQFPGSGLNDLIYWPDAWFGEPSLFRDANGVFKPESELSNDQILAYAMAKSGRKLAGAPKDVPLPFAMPAAK